MMYRLRTHREAPQVQPDYQPNTVTTDGGNATLNAWKTLFPTLGILQCVLHAMLGIRKVATKATYTRYSTMVENAWQVYQGDTTRSFSQRY